MSLSAYICDLKWANVMCRLERKKNAISNRYEKGLRLNHTCINLLDYVRKKWIWQFKLQQTIIYWCGIGGQRCCCYCYDHTLVQISLFNLGMSLYSFSHTKGTFSYIHTNRNAYVLVRQNANRTIWYARGSVCVCVRSKSIWVNKYKQLI